MKNAFWVACWLALPPATGLAQSTVRVEQLRCEHLQNPMGIGVLEPRLSWQLVSSETGEAQTAYEIRAGSTAAGLAAPHPDIWDSGEVMSDRSVLVPWGGKPLASRSRVFWQVRVWDQDNILSAWSAPASFEVGLVSASDWKARWIAADFSRYVAAPPIFAGASWIGRTGPPGESVAYRRELDLPAGVGVRSAEVYVSAEGGFTFFVNGRMARSGGGRPGAWVNPVRGDFGTALVGGRNVLAFSAGPGGLIARLSIELGDGKHINLVSDGSWKSSALLPDGWQAPALDDSAWAQAAVLGPYGAKPWGEFLTNNTIGPGRYLRKSFTVEKPVARARLYATALGVYEASVNGQRVGETLLNPGWTDYAKRVMVQVTDVTRLVLPGRNTIGAILGDGWYAGRLGWMGLAQYGTRPAFAAQLEITYIDGSSDTIVTDGSWKAGRGEIIGSDEQWGEVIDRRRAIPGWDRPSSDDSSWAGVVVEEHAAAPAPMLGPPVRQLDELPPRNISRLGGAWIVDFGQNMVGHVRLAATGPSGTTIRVRHAEVLNADGSLYTANLRPVLATDTFILGGGPDREVFEPHFTFHGFRYVEVSGFPGTLTPADIRGIVVGSDVPATGTFDSSNPDLDRLYQNIVWGQRGNFLSVPTDCPQRDERMGWMGDAEVFAPTAARNSDVAAFFEKWLADVDDAQGPQGDFSNFSPRVAAPQPGMAAWGDAGVICPWVMYTAYGDREFLARNYSAMVRWVEYCRLHSENLLRPAAGVGDHLSPGVPTPLDVVATAYFAHSTDLLARSAGVLGRKEDAAKYGLLFHEITDAFARAFVVPDGAIKGDTQTAYLLALEFGLLPESLRPLAAGRLVANIEAQGHLTTGFIGVGLICPVLTAIDRSDLAWRLVLNDSYPSWLFSVKNGATTVWERWDGWTPEHGFQDPAMNSFNHYSLGSVGAWLYSGAAGIQPDDAHPGYKHFFLRPQLTPRLTWLGASIHSPYGTISSRWRVDGDLIRYDVIVPPNSSAEMTLPVPSKDVAQAGQPIAAAGDAVTRLPLAAGVYHFSFPSARLPQADAAPAALK